VDPLVPLVPVVQGFLDSQGKYGFGLETCPETGRPHIQGWVSFTKKVRAAQATNEVMPGAHWEKSKGSRSQNIDYCSKEGQYFTNVKSVYDVIRDKGPLPWQQRVLDLIASEPDSRKIHWFYNETGNVGKTALSKHLVLTRSHETVFLSSGRAQDWTYMVGQFEDPLDIRSIVIDLPRDVGDIPWEAAEKMKDGLVFSSKYECKSIVFNPPHVIFFANRAPSDVDRLALSDDRWVVEKI